MRALIFLAAALLLALDDWVMVVAECPLLAQSGHRPSARGRVMIARLCYSDPERFKSVLQCWRKTSAGSLQS